VLCPEMVATLCAYASSHHLSRHISLPCAPTYISEGGISHHIRMAELGRLSVQLGCSLAMKSKIRVQLTPV
jgi:hypothetical protein